MTKFSRIINLAFTAYGHDFKENGYRYFERTRTRLFCLSSCRSSVLFSFNSSCHRMRLAVGSSAMRPFDGD